MEPCSSRHDISLQRRRSTTQRSNLLSQLRRQTRRWLARKDGDCPTKNPDYQKAHAELASAAALARAVINARVATSLTQEQLAQHVDTAQSVIARLERGRTRHSTQTLERFAAATGARFRINFERVPARQ